jgi:hypothetical protein
MGDSSYRRNFNLDKKNEIQHHTTPHHTTPHHTTPHHTTPREIEHLKMSKIAKFGCEML